MNNLNLYEKDKIQKERQMDVYKRDDMIQKGRFKLSVQEQRAVLFAISKIKATDTYLTEYTFDIKEFYRVIGWKNESYTEFKSLLKGLADKSWWAEIDDAGTESVVRWFTTVRSNKRSGKVTIRFHEDMMPFLLQLTEQGEFYTYFNLRYVLPMSSKHSPRLYEILKSYQKNNQEWYFEIDVLKKLMDCENYKNFNDFEKRALKTAVEEINKYTDIRIKYFLQREGRRVSRVVFMMDKKTSSELYQTDVEIQVALDGQQSLFEIDKEVTEKVNWTIERRAAKREG